MWLIILSMVDEFWNIEFDMYWRGNGLTSHDMWFRRKEESSANVLVITTTPIISSDQDHPQWFHHPRVPGQMDVAHQVPGHDSGCVCWPLTWQRRASSPCRLLHWLVLITDALCLVIIFHYLFLLIATVGMKSFIYMFLNHYFHLTCIQYSHRQYIIIHVPQVWEKWGQETWDPVSSSSRWGISCLWGTYWGCPFQSGGGRWIGLHGSFI